MLLIVKFHFSGEILFLFLAQFLLLKQLFFLIYICTFSNKLSIIYFPDSNIMKFLTIFAVCQSIIYDIFYHFQIFHNICFSGAGPVLNIQYILLFPNILLYLSVAGGGPVLNVQSYIVKYLDKIKFQGFQIFHNICLLQAVGQSSIYPFF